MLAENSPNHDLYNSLIIMIHLAKATLSSQLRFSFGLQIIANRKSINYGSDLRQLHDILHFQNIILRAVVDRIDHRQADFFKGARKFGEQKMNERVHP
jgi:hypothetical protein